MIWNTRNTLDVVCYTPPLVGRSPSITKKKKIGMPFPDLCHVHIGVKRSAPHLAWSDPSQNITLKQYPTVMDFHVTHLGQDVFTVVCIVELWSDVWTRTALFDAATSTDNPPSAFITSLYHNFLPSLIWIHSAVLKYHIFPDMTDLCSLGAKI